MIARKFTPLLVLLLCLLSGCVYLRLQKLKDQLGRFDFYFKVDQSSGLKLECLEPVLYSQDIIWMRLFPNQRNDNGAEQRWIYVLQKLYPQDRQESENYDITYELGFTDNKLSQMFFPNRFLSIVPSPFVIAVLKSIGKGEIDRSRRTLNGKTPEEKMAAPVEVPTRQDILRNLGEPFSMEKPENKEQWRYQYRARISETENTVVHVVFTFNPTSDKLSNIFVRYLQSDFSFNFRQQFVACQENRPNICNRADIQPVISFGTPLHEPTAHGGCDQQSQTHENQHDAFKRDRGNLDGAYDGTGRLASGNLADLVQPATNRSRFFAVHGEKGHGAG